MRLLTKDDAGQPMLRTILSLAGPTMLEQLLQTAVSYIDIAMIGALGTYATAAVGATTTVHWLVNSSISALGIGFLSHIARACGEEDGELSPASAPSQAAKSSAPSAAARKRAAHITGQALLATLAVGLLFTFLTVALSPAIPRWMQVEPALRPLASRYFLIIYLPMLPRTASLILGNALRAAGDTKTPMKISLLMNVMNVVLNFFLIFPARNVSVGGFALGNISFGEFTLFLPGAGLGVAGAAIASAVAFTFGGLGITAALLAHPVISPRGLSLRPRRDILLPCLKTALPNMLQRFATSLGYVAFASMINSLGSVATAAHTIANTVESAFYIPAFGMQTAAATLAGYCLGAGDNRKMRDFSRMMILLEIGLMTFSGTLLFLFAPAMVSLFTGDPAVIRLGTLVLRMVALSEPFYGVVIALEGMILGVGQTVVPLRFNLFGMWGVRIVGTFLCVTVFRLGLSAAWGCMIFHNLILFVLYFLYYRRGRWNPLNDLPHRL